MTCLDKMLTSKICLKFRKISNLPFWGGQIVFGAAFLAFWPADTVCSDSVNDPKKVRLYLFAALNGRHHVKSRFGVFVPFVAPDEDLRVEMLGCLLGASG